MRRKILAVVLAAAAALTCIACGTQTSEKKETEKTHADAPAPEEEEAEETPEFVVGIAAPEQGSDRWSGELAYLTESLEGEGFTVVTRQASDGSGQAEQLGELAEEVSALILIPSDPSAAADALQVYEDQDIPVISYNQLVPDTDAVTYYVGFDSEAAGEAVGTFIEAQNNLEGAQEAGESYTIEFLMEDSKELDNQFFYEGVRSVLGPYLDDGTLQSRSGRTSFVDLCLDSADPEKARTKLTEILEQSYGEEPLDIVCAQSDELLDGAAQALQEKNYSLYSTQTPWPLLTGQGASENGIRRILNGTQGITVSREFQLLDDSCVEILTSIRDGEDVEVNTSGKYDNGSRIVPAQLADVQAIDLDNYKILADKGIYTEEELESFASVTQEP